VCIAVLNNVVGKLSKEQKKDMLKTEQALGDYCGKPAGGEKEVKFCYFVDPIKRDISTPVKNGVPVSTICDRLKKKAPEVCALRYSSTPAGPAITKATDLGKLRVKDLKAFIAEKNIVCSPCTDKEDLTKAVEGYFKAHPEL